MSSFVKCYEHMNRCFLQCISMMVCNIHCCVHIHSQTHRHRHALHKHTHICTQTHQYTHTCTQLMHTTKHTCTQTHTIGANLQSTIIMSNVKRNILHQHIACCQIFCLIIIYQENPLFTSYKILILIRQTANTDITEP